MAYNSIKKVLTAPIGWLIAAILLSGMAGWCYARHLIWPCMILAICAVSCAFVIVKGFARINKRLIYIMEATLNGDFSYKFPTENVSGDERNINRMLNRIVEHFEHLSAQTRQNESFLSWVINLADVGIVVADEKGHIRHHNEAALRILERAALTHTCQIDPQSYPDLNIKATSMMLNGKCIAVYTITDLRHPIQTAEVESWEKLIRVLTHEIMNSLTPIQSIAETMGDKASSSDMAEALDTISSSSKSLMQFVRNFRKFSILPDPQMRVVYLKPLLEKCVRMSEAYAKEPTLRITSTCFPPDLMAYTDEALLSQVILNIVKNAIEANPSHVTIDADIKSNESVEIKITNDGTPIPGNISEQIFTPFFTTKQGGSGIGLSLSRRIISHLGGTLTLVTKPLTSFAVRL